MVKETPVVAWDAQEYVVRSKNTGWYIGLIIIGALFVALSVWLQWWTFTALIVLSVIALIVYSTRPPRILHYELTKTGLTDGSRTYKYSDYKAFGILKENSHFSIIMIPRKRFSPRVTVYFPETHGEAIVDAFGAHLPMAEVRLDILDRIIKFLRI